MRALCGFLLVCGALSLAGCPQGLLPCRAAGDCAAPDVCINGKCVLSCDKSADCTGGDVCNAGICGPAAAEGEGEGGEGEGGEGEGGEGEGGEGEGGEGEGGEGEGGEGEGGEGEGGEGEGEGEGGSNCGNGALDGGEQCDDGNNNGGDGCSAACAIENGFVCRGAPSLCAQLPVADHCASSGTDPFRVDINNDCIPDLVVGNPNVSAISLVQGLNNGTFQQTNPFGPTENDGRFGSAIALEPDITGTGTRGIYVTRGAHAEVWYINVAATFLSSTTGFLENGTSTTFGSQAMTVLRSGPAFHGKLAFTDNASLFATGDVPAPGVQQPVTATQIVDGAAGAVASIVVGPDEDGDGLPDLVVGSPGRGNPVFFLSSLTLNPVGRVFAAPSNAASFGEVVANVGDLDADGVDDIAIAAPRDGTGRVFVNLSTKGIGLVEITPPAGTNQKARFGNAIAPIGDVDGDGISDIMIGAPFQDLGGALLNNGTQCASTADCNDATLLTAAGPTRGFPGLGTVCSAGLCVDPNNEPHCGTLLNDASYVGDCGGAVSLAKSVDVVAAAATAPSILCVNADQNSPALRLGFALAPLGTLPAVAGNSPRVAVGSPGDPLHVDGSQAPPAAAPQPGTVFFIAVRLDANGTCGASGLAFNPGRIDGLIAGGEFGATFGR